MSSHEQQKIAKEAEKNPGLVKFKYAKIKGQGQDNSFPLIK